VHRHLTLLPRGSKNLDVGLRLTRSARQGSPAVAPDAVVFDLNEEASLELQNQSSNPVYVSLVELTRQGDIKLLYPDPRFQQENRSNRIPPHSGWIRIGASVLLSPPGQVLWKLLITQQQADFSGIAHQRVLKGGNAAATAAVEQLPASAQPLGRLLLYAVQRQRSQSLVAQPQDFATRDYWLHIGSAQRGRP
jgi:hypothetical protein